MAEFSLDSSERALFEEGYDLDTLCEYVSKEKCKRVVLQFPDEELGSCVSVYEEIRQQLPLSTQVYIAADSTFGSSVDDISAQHVDSDLLVYFGSDLSSSGSMPVIVVPYRRSLGNIEEVAKVLCDTMPQDDATSQDTDVSRSHDKVLLLYDPSYYATMEALVHEVDMLGMSSSAPVPHVHLAKLPECADLHTPLRAFTRSMSTLATTEERQEGKDGAAELPPPPPAPSGAPSEEIIGGLIAPKALLEDPGLRIWYVGDKDAQVVNIMLRLSSADLAIYSPSSKAARMVQGQSRREYAQRYGGISRVKDASIIGIIVGSMGLTGAATNTLVSRLRRLIDAAKKRAYVLVMGRLNDAKLCNFPEVDVFCLISNEDTALIPAKTFHVPVLTPYELEIGLGARDWTGNYVNSCATLLDEGDEGFSSQGLQVMLERVRQEFIEAYEQEEELMTGLPSKEEEGEKAGQGQEQEQKLEQELQGLLPPQPPSVAQDGTTEVSGSEKESEKVSVSDRHGQVARRQDDRLTVFQSPALAFFKGRSFQGLEYSAEVDAPTVLEEGLYGTASGYIRQKPDLVEDSPL